MFTIQKIKLGKENVLRLVNAFTQEYAEIIPSKGAILNDLVLKIQDKLVSIIEGYTDDTDLEKNYSSVYKSSFLFPFPNRIRDGKYTFESKNYQLNLNQKQENNAIHGLVYDKKFELISTESGAERSKIVLKYVSEWQEGFPFLFEVTLVYSLDAQGLRIESEVENHSPENMPFGLGWHHYFRLGNSIDGYSLKFPSVYYLELDEQKIPTGKKHPFTEYKNSKKIESTIFDTCFELEKKSKTLVELGSENLSINLRFDTKDFPYLQIYTPAHRNSIAIEPMSAAPDCFNNELGLETLGAGKRKSYLLEITK